jgi:hypothetical protein
MMAFLEASKISNVGFYFCCIILALHPHPITGRVTMVSVGYLGFPHFLTVVVRH